VRCRYYDDDEKEEEEEVEEEERCCKVGYNTGWVPCMTRAELPKRTRAESDVTSFSLLGLERTTYQEIQGPSNAHQVAVQITDIGVDTYEG